MGDIQPEQAPGAQQKQQQQPAADAAAQALVRREFIQCNRGLTTVPVKVMALTDLELLDLANNAIEVIPKGLFSDIPKLKSCNLSSNSIKALPDDMAALKELNSLVLHHNCLAALPDALYTLAALRVLDVSDNRLEHVSNDIGAMQGLQVLNLAANRLRSIPGDVGWLALKQLNVSGNRDLHIPAHVLQRGFRAVMCFLQVVGEQHQQVEAHMSAFTARRAKLQASPVLPGGVEDEEAVLLQVRLAQMLGVLSCSHARLAALPHGFTAQPDALADVQVVDLAHNRLEGPPCDVLRCAMSALLVLDLSYNSLRSWPAGLHLPALRVLDCSFNRLAALPEDLGDVLPALQQLYCANNFLTGLPDSLARLQLLDLFLSENALRSVPPVLGRCAPLAKLSMAACELAGDCAELEGLSNLRFLDLSFNKLAGLSPRLSALRALGALGLAFNPLPCFPDVLSCLTALRELNLDHTGLAALPRGLGELRLLEGLQADGCPLAPPLARLYARSPLLLVALHDPALLALDLSECGLDAVPQPLLLQTQLTSLNLGKNAIQELPLGLGQLRRLRHLVLKGNPLRQPFARLIDARGELAVLPLLRPEGASGRLDLAACGFDALPPLVWAVAGRAEALLELTLTNNRLKELPQELSALVALTRLILDSNLLHVLPDVVLQLPALAVLQASSNSIAFLPDQLGRLQSLQALVLAGNQVRKLPESVSALTRLKSLSLASNRLWQLPAGLCCCTALKLLDCSHNLLARLPLGISALGSLKSLKLTHNRLEWVPSAELLLATALEELLIAANPFTVEAFDAADVMGRPAVQQLLAAVRDSPFGTAPEPQAFAARAAQPGSMTAGSSGPTHGPEPDTATGSLAGRGLRAAGDPPQAAGAAVCASAGRSSGSGSGSCRFGLLGCESPQASTAPAVGSGSPLALQQQAAASSACKPGGDGTSGETASPFAQAGAAVVACSLVSGRSSGAAVSSSETAAPEPSCEHAAAAAAVQPCAAAAQAAAHAGGGDTGGVAAALACITSRPEEAGEHVQSGSMPPSTGSAGSGAAAAAHEVQTVELAAVVLVPSAPAPAAANTSRKEPGSMLSHGGSEQQQQQQQQQHAPGGTRGKLQTQAGAKSKAQAAPPKAAAVAPGKLQQPGGLEATPAGVARATAPEQLAAGTRAPCAACCATAQQGHAAAAGGSERPPSAVAAVAAPHGRMLLQAGWTPLLLPPPPGAAAPGPATWHGLPLMGIPRLVRACSQAPPPPQPPVACRAAEGAGAPPPAVARPQTRLRFWRVMEQSVAALELLEGGMQPGAPPSPT